LQDSHLGRSNRNKPTETFKFFRTESCYGAAEESRIVVLCSSGRHFSVCAAE
jgi:hypothetical protein